MSDKEEMGKLFFELASENRFTILQLLNSENLKMQEIAQRLDVTATEAFRQLQRLTEISLVQRQPDGTFAITQYGRLALHLSSSYGFISKHRDYFLSHDIWGLPVQFVNRIGELSEATLNMDTIESVNKGIQIFLEAEEYAWGLSVRGGGSDHLDTFIDEQVKKGVKFCLIIPEEHLISTTPLVEDNIEVKGCSELRASIAISEKEALVSFPFNEGRIDYAGFTGTDPTFLNWAKELFQYYWKIGKTI